MKFPCTSCGLCCKTAGRMAETARQLIQDGNEDGYVQEVANFPHAFDPTGRCSKLGEDNRCTIYENRPDICNIEKTWAKYHSKGISQENYFLSAAMICNQMMAQEHYPGNFFIQIPDNENYNGTGMHAV